ncbi:MAG TPA: hypothetical protein VF316_15910 [Polyangiaceae bacterium]
MGAAHTRNACFVCGRGNALPAAEAACAVCSACCAPVGRVLEAAPHAALAAWLELPTKTNAPVPRGRSDADRRPSKDDVRAHCDLALAYAEMGLSEDAVREAGVVLGHTDDDRMRLSALTIAFGMVKLRPGGIAGVAAAVAEDVARRALSELRHAREPRHDRLPSAVTFLARPGTMNV